MYPLDDDDFNSRSSRRPHSADWSVGDRVLAPWEPHFLYAGTVAEIRADEAHIDFDDGDSGWVPLGELRELHLEIDQFVMCRKQMGAMFYPATIEDVSGETVHVGFDDGETEWTTVAAVRVPRTTAGAGAAPTNIGSPHSFTDFLQRGMRVLAPWENVFLYPGTILDVTDGEAHVHFDDGDTGWVTLPQIHPLELTPGLTLLVRGPGKGYQTAEVVSAEGEDVEVRFESGQTKTVRLNAIRVPCKPAGPNARASNIGRQGDGGSAWSWLIPIVIIVGIILFVRWLAN